MRIYKLFKINQLLRQAKKSIEDIQQINEQYEAIGKEQNELLIEARGIITQQGAIIQTHERTIDQLREQLATNNRTTFTSAPPGAAPPGANEPMKPV